LGDDDTRSSNVVLNTFCVRVSENLEAIPLHEANYNELIDELARHQVLVYGEQVIWLHIEE